MCFVETRDRASQLRRSDRLQTGMERSEIPGNDSPQNQTPTGWQNRIYALAGLQNICYFILVVPRRM